MVVSVFVVSVSGRQGALSKKHTHKLFSESFPAVAELRAFFPRAVSGLQRVPTKWHFIISRRLWWFPPPR